MESDSKPKIGVIVSTTRPSRKGRFVADWFMQQVKANAKAEFALFDLQEINLPFLNEQESPATGKYQHQHTKDWSRKVSECDGFVFITAEYNNGPPAPLKNAIDTIYKEWDKKPVAFVGYGAYGATRAIEQLVNITAKIGMVPLPKTFVGIVKPWDAIREDGSIDEDLVMGNLDGLLDNLLWWTNTLRNNR